MSGIATAVVAGAVITSYAQQDASSKANEATTNASRQSIAESRRQFDAVQALLQPYVSTGNDATSQMRALLGLNGDQAQASAIQGVKDSSEFTGLQKLGENSILQNASATGGLRGGNVQAALGQYSPALLNSLLQQRYQNLAGLSQQGQNAASGTASAALTTGQQVSDAYQTIGASGAGAALASGQATANSINQGAGQLMALKALKVF